MVPLGLVLLSSVAFGVGGVRLAGNKVLTRELAAVEAWPASMSSAWTRPGGSPKGASFLTACMSWPGRQLAASGLRTVLLAYADGTTITGNGPTLPADVHPVVVLTFRERIRPDARQTLDYFRDEGVELRVISGDDPRTVAAIARTVGLEVEEGYDARQLPADPLLLEEAMDDNTVFGRVSPHQKKNMVAALQRRGHTVAMTGDGGNDVLALKDADLGIAMNSAAPATMAVARLVLLDGRFDRLPGVVAEGRRVIANIERVYKLFVPVLRHPRRSHRCVFTAGVDLYATSSGAAGAGSEPLQSASVLTLSVTGLWIVTVVSRPLDAKKLAAGGFAAGSPRRRGWRGTRPRAPGLDSRQESPPLNGRPKEAIHS